MKKINYQNARFLTSVAKLSQLPPEEGIEVAFAGRSNVGKSSALNALTHQKSLARTSKTPGRTQLLNFFELDDGNRLVDLPGYGYAKVSRSIKERWQATLAKYLESRECLKGIILLMDIRHPLKEFDAMMIDWAIQCQTPAHILLTKSDKLSRSAAFTVLKKTEKTIGPNPLISIQLFSSLKKTGLEELKSKLTEWFQNR